MLLHFSKCLIHGTQPSLGPEGCAGLRTKYYNQNRVDSGKAMKLCEYTDPDSSPNKERTVPISLSITKPPS